MGLEVGIVGLPNSGKSTLLNALLGRQIAHVAEYPFTTIESNAGVVEVPDERLLKLAEIVTGTPRQTPVPSDRSSWTSRDPCSFRNDKGASLNGPLGGSSVTVNRSLREKASDIKIIPAAIKFIDIAGLVKDAHKGAGLGNRFLAKIRECDAILHVVREFENPQVAHVMGSLDPQRDIEIINEELRQAGIEKPTFVYLNKEYPNELILDTIISECYKLLNLITMFTIEGGEQLQAWPVKQGLTIWQAAGMIHTDFQEKFIKAEVVNYEKLLAAGSYAQAKAKGQTRIEGKDYLLADGDVVTVKI